jgi:cell division protein FtsB
MLGTDLIAVMIALITSVGVMIITIKKNAELERENAWLRERVSNLRKQVFNMVDKNV